MRKTDDTRPLRVYICHPYADAPEENTAKVREIARSLVSERLLPIAPHLYLPQLVDEATDRALALRLCLDLVDICDEVWVHGGRITAGMAREIAHATARGIPVRGVGMEVAP